MWATLLKLMRNYENAEGVDDIPKLICWHTGERPFVVYNGETIDTELVKQMIETLHELFF